MAEPTTTQERMDALLDEVMLKVLERGILHRDAKGEPLRDAGGALVYGPPPAAYLQSIRQRLKDLGIEKVPAAHSDAATLAEKIGLDDGDDAITAFVRRHGGTLKISDFDHQDDAATA